MIGFSPVEARGGVPGTPGYQGNRGGGRFNRYDRGWRENWRQVMGTGSAWGWLVPVAQPSAPSWGAQMRRRLLRIRRPPHRGE